MQEDALRECGNCFCFGLRRAARIVTQHYDRHLRQAGLRATQFTVLATLAQTGPMPLNRLARRLGLERTTLTRNLRPLEARGWVRIETEEDRRVHRVAITPAGETAARDALPLWRKAQASAPALISELQLDGLLANAAAG
jgi:DNA-binding MarR family transcriptional regulator